MTTTTTPGDAPVNTKQAERREISYASLNDLAADLDRLEASHRAGALRTTGNWTPGQVFQHCAILMRSAIDGFPSSAPAPVRWILTLLFKKKALSGDRPPAGFKIPKAASFLKPAPDVSFDQGIGELREVIRRIESGERFTHPSPIFGKLTHGEWTRLQLGHCGLHLSFLHPNGAAA